MAGYDPQKGRSRPRPSASDPSPVDELLGDEDSPDQPADGVEEVEVDIVEPDLAGVESGVVAEAVVSVPEVDAVNNDNTNSASSPPPPAARAPQRRVAPVPAEDAGIDEYKTYGIAALLLLVLLYLLRKRK